MFSLARGHGRLSFAAAAVALVALAAGLAIWNMSKSGPGDEAWRQIEVPSGTGESWSVTMDVPAGWQVTQGKGYDSMGGRLIGNEMTVVFETGSGDVVSWMWHDQDALTRTETIGDGVALIHMPDPASAGPETVSGAFFRRVPGSPYPPDVRVLSLYAKGLTHDQQQTLLRIIRSVKYVG